MNRDKAHKPYLQKKHEKSEMAKKPTGFIMTIAILALIVVALALLLFATKNPLDNILRNYQNNYPDSLLSIQRLSGENAQVLAQQISTYCHGFNLDEYYLAQIDELGTQKSVLYVINPSNGKTVCVIDRTTATNTTQPALSQNLLATINGDPVYMEEVLAVYNNIPENLRTNTSMQESLDQVINNKLLLQDATSKGFSVTEEEVDNAINAFMTNNGLTLQQLEQNLINAGSSIQEFRGTIRRDLVLQQEINDVTKDVEAPSEQDIQNYYEENKQTLTTIPRAVIKQLLLYANESNAAEKQEQIKAIAELYNGTNFCDLINQYSEDTLSVSRCGLYDFQQGQLLPEFENLVFSSEPGSVKIIQTSLGFHIVQILNVTLPRLLSFEEAKDGISNYLVLINKQAVLNQYILNLREQADIVSYLG